MDIREIVSIDTLLQKEKKKNVCAYARVSTLKDLAHLSFDNQVQNYTSMILQNKEWNFIGVFADEGKSGTNATMRTQFTMMIDMAKSGLIDLIITKSISRFSRNVVDTISILHELKGANVEVWFENENISSFDPKIEFVISVLSGMAEEEARNVSENVKWNVRKRFSEGKFYMVTRGFLGYTLDEHGNLTIEETEATIVRAIYEKYTQCVGVPQIVKWLNDNQVKTTYNYGKWYDAAIYNILKNEKYTGNALLQKTMRPSFKSKNKVKNETLPMYYVENSHTPIISQGLFEEAQSIRLGRIKKYHSESTLINKEKYIAKSKYSGLVKCGECGRSYIHRLGNQASPYSKEIMVCIQNKGCKTCPGDNISMSILEQAIQKQVDYIIQHKKAFLQQVFVAVQNNPKRLELVRNQEELGKKIEILEEKKCGLKGVQEEFSRMVQAEIEREITSCRLELANTNNLLATTYNPDRSKQQIQEILYPYIRGKEIDGLVPLLFESITVINQRLLEFRIRHVNTDGKEKTEALNETYTIRKKENRLEHYVVL